MNTRLNRHKAKQERIIKHLKRWKLYTSLVIIISLVSYIVFLGTIQFAQQLFSLEVDAPTHKIYAQEEDPTIKDINTWETFKKRAEALAPIYDFPVKVILSQAALESAHGTSKYAKERNNYFGFQCYDRDPDQYCAYFDNVDQGIIKYMQLIQSEYPDAYEARNNPDRMIELIKAGGYATDPRYVSKIMSLEEWSN